MTLVTRTMAILIFMADFVMVASQDIHFSQYTASPLLVNPAFSGFLNGNLRAGLNYRNQGASVSTPYKTYSASIDGVIQPSFMNDDWFGLGGIFYNDNAGDGSLQKTSVMVTGVLHKGFNRFSTLIGSLGFAVGFTNMSVDFSKLTFGNQWNGSQFDPNISNQENYKTSSFFYLDLNVGFMMSLKLRNSSNVSAGASLNHVNKPRETFYAGSNRLGWKWIAHGNANIEVSEYWFLESGIMYTYMDDASELKFGGNFHYGKGDARFCLGLWYRLNRDIIPMIGMDYDNYSLLFSYDINISELKAASNSQGGIEISLQKNFRWPNRRDPCESLRFR